VGTITGMKLSSPAALVLSGLAFLTAIGAAASTELNVYSYRQEYLVQPLIERFTERQGVTVNIVYIKEGLLERLKAEGPNSPADVVLTADVARLDALAEAGLLRAVSSPLLDHDIPTQYHGPDGLWFGLTTRARVVYYARARIEPGELSTYEDLADPRWRGRICMRSAHHIYNRGLIAAMIAHHGEATTETWLRGVKANLARRPQGNDRAQIKAITEGLCDLSIGNTYYMGLMKQDEEQRHWAEAVAIFFPNQGDPDRGGRGTHINISGVAVAKSTKHLAAAVAFIEFLSGDEAQRTYAELNLEYPVKAGVPWHPEVESWGRFEADRLGLDAIATYGPAATMLVDRVGFDD
jgi:iron(III) transport system substrate-binding protein